MKELLRKLREGLDLSEAEVESALMSMATGKADPVQVGAFLSLWAVKKETANEIAATVRVMRSVMHSVAGGTEQLLDIVGTGGDGANTVNLSTGAAVLAAAAGATVAKHGNRSVSSRSGSADVLEVLGVPMLKPEHIVQCLAESQIAFMYSPHFHPAMKYVVPVRRAIGIRTVFNILGPLLNPACCQQMMVGVFKPELLKVFAEVFQALEIKHALVVHCAGLDELNPIGVAECAEVKDGEISYFSLDPQKDLGIPKCTLEDLKGGDANTNAEILRSVFSGKDKADNPIGNTIALNAGAGLYVFGTVDSIKEGYEVAKDVLASGKALTTLDNWVECAQKLQNSAV